MDTDVDSTQVYKKKSWQQISESILSEAKRQRNTIPTDSNIPEFEENLAQSESDFPYFDEVEEDSIKQKQKSKKIEDCRL